MAAVHQYDGTGYKRDNPPYAQYAEAGHKGLADNEGKPQQNQRQARVIDGQHLEGKQCEDQADSANHTREYRPGVG